METTHVRPRFAGVSIPPALLKDIFSQIIRHLDADARCDLGRVSKEALGWTRAAVVTLMMRSRKIPWKTRPPKPHLVPYANVTTLSFLDQPFCDTRVRKFRAWDRAAFPAAKNMELNLPVELNADQVNVLAGYPLNVTRFAGTWPTFVALCAVIPEERWRDLETVEIFPITGAVVNARGVLGVPTTRLHSPCDRQRAVTRLTAKPLKSLKMGSNNKMDTIMTQCISMDELMECPPAHLIADTQDLIDSVVQHPNAAKLESCEPIRNAWSPIYGFLAPGKTRHHKKLAMAYTYKMRLDPHYIYNAHPMLVELDSTAAPNAIIMAFVALAYSETSIFHSPITDPTTRAKMSQFASMAAPICLERPDVLLEVLFYINAEKRIVAIYILLIIAVHCHSNRYGPVPFPPADSPYWDTVERIAERLFGATWLDLQWADTFAIYKICAPSTCPRLWRAYFLHIKFKAPHVFLEPIQDPNDSGMPAFIATPDGVDAGIRHIIREVSPDARYYIPLDFDCRTIVSWTDVSSALFTCGKWAEVVLCDRVNKSSFMYIYNSIHQTVSPAAARTILLNRRYLLSHVRRFVNRISSAPNLSRDTKILADVCTEKLSTLERDYCTGVLGEVLLGTGEIVLR